MSDIKAGDLVIVMRNHCTDYGVGHIFKVERVLVSPLYCGFCLQSIDPSGVGVLSVDPDEAAPLSWLKRIPPLDELEHEETSREIEKHQTEIA